MSLPLKADFHLHTYHSDNHDRMTPAEYVAAARARGYGVLGFCDHHHNLTADAWALLQAETAALASPDLLLTTGYEATWMVGHLCVLGKQVFDGGTIAECTRQLWSPANTRILAHPDNNPCAWRLPLPVGIQGVEVINGGQDPYAVKPNSFCNGLATFMRYLLLNHPVAAIAQSDCHDRAVFGRVHTALLPDDEAPLTWHTVRDTLMRHHTLAVMGDLSVRVWAADGARPGDRVTDPACTEIGWEAPPHAAVTVYVADRPVATYAPGAPARHPIAHNGPHWLLIQRGLAWAVSSPIWVATRPGPTPAQRAGLAAHSVVRAATDRLRRDLDRLEMLATAGAASPYPTAAYLEWLRRQLPAQWTDADPAWTGPGAAEDWARARIDQARTILGPILHAAARAAHQTFPRPEEPRLILLPAAPGIAAGVYQAVADVPRRWPDVAVTTAAGAPVTVAALPIPGERDPIQGMRTRAQMPELVVWLARGEIHEYVLHTVDLTCSGGKLRLLVDLYPAALGYASTPRPATAAALAAWIDDPTVAEFYVHLRMPRRFALWLRLPADPAADRLVLTLAPAVPHPANEERTPFYQEDALVADLSDQALVVQVY